MWIVSKEMKFKIFLDKDFWLFDYYVFSTQIKQTVNIFMKTSKTELPNFQS